MVFVWRGACELKFSEKSRSLEEARPARPFGDDEGPSATAPAHDILGKDAEGFTSALSLGVTFTMSCHNTAVGAWLAEPHTHTPHQPPTDPGQDDPLESRIGEVKVRVEHGVDRERDSQTSVEPCP